MAKYNCGNCSEAYECTIHVNIVCHCLVLHAAVNYKLSEGVFCKTDRQGHDYKYPYTASCNNVAISYIKSCNI